MQQFDQQVLRLLAHTQAVFASPVWSCEILEKGKTIYGSNWGGPERTSSRFVRYAPLVSLSLGRLKKLGLIKTKQQISAKGSSQYEWELTETGELFIQQWKASHASV